MPFFLSDVETEAELTSDGSYLGPGMLSSCLIFDSLEETEQYCRRRVEDIPRLRCDVFDSQGKAQPPLATFVNQRHEHKLESPAKASRLMRWSLLPMAASLPLFWYTWKTRGEGWIASLFGIQFIFAGLRLLHWGYSMKEELGSRQARSELLRQRAGETRHPRTRITRHSKDPQPPHRIPRSRQDSASPAWLHAREQPSRVLAHVTAPHTLGNVPSARVS
jgi:hypothetical protein